MIAKAWRRLPTPPAGFSALLGLPALHAHLLYNRGIRQRAEIDPFLKADSRLRNDPMLLPDMEKAVTRLKKALRSDETIGIFEEF
ncbi:MAG: single-stranded-DNA-specific exonuclease RecJ, partial [Chloroflexi bacterium]|nr:single-stranded-DNA-specific exonuclease RecJ [Chloroflexota bacterium]